MEEKTTVTTPPEPVTPPVTTPPAEDDISTFESFNEEITIPQHKQLFGEKFKTYGGFAKSYREVEKDRGKILSERDTLSKQIEDYESQILDLNDKIEKSQLASKQTGGNGEDKTKLEEIKAQLKMKLQSGDPEQMLEAITEILGKYDEYKTGLTKEEKDKQEREQIKQEFTETEKKYVEKYGEEKWKIMKVELAQIMKQKPYINSLRDIVAIWKDQQDGKEEELKAEQTRKEGEKLSARSETGSGTPPLPKDVMEEINNATTSEQINKLGNKLKGKKL